MNSTSANRIYPPLPKPAHVEYQQGFVHDIEHPYFSAEQMHAFLDDGCAMRAISTPENYRADQHGSECYDEACGGCIAAPKPAVASFDLDADLARTIDQRDTAEGWADGLAALIGKHFGESIGEHSSAHNPWQEAKDIIETAAPYQAATLEVLRSFAEGRIQHINKGLCPDHIAGHGSRDPECAICRALDQQGGV